MGSGGSCHYCKRYVCQCDHQQRVAVIGEMSQGGFLVPVEFNAELEACMTTEEAENLKRWTPVKCLQCNWRGPAAKAAHFDNSSWGIACPKCLAEIQIVKANPDA